MTIPITKTICGYEVHDYNNIFIIDNILSDELCEKYINLIKTLPMDKNKYSCINNVECFSLLLNDLLNQDFNEYYDINTQHFEYETLLDKIKNKKILTNNIGGYTKEEIKYLFFKLNEITDKIKEILKQLSIHYSTALLKYNSGYILRKIYGRTRTHIDGNKLSKQFNIMHLQQYQETREINMNNVIIRNLSGIFTLNDDYDGGLFQFPNHNLEFKLKKGSLLLFPPYWTHRHQTTELLNETFRYTITVWYGEDITNND